MSDFEEKKRKRISAKILYKDANEEVAAKEEAYG